MLILISLETYMSIGVKRPDKKIASILIFSIVKTLEALLLIPSNSLILIGFGHSGKKS